MVISVALLTIIGCAQERSPSAASDRKKAENKAENSAVKAKITPILATDRDPTALDEALADALLELQNKFKCNRISGCEAQDRIIQFGWTASRPAQRQFAKAKPRAAWRARMVRIVAELRDPGALPFLLTTARDRDDEAAGYALYGLALQNYPEAADLYEKWRDAGAGLQFGFSRLSARWALAREGNEADRAAFVAELVARGGQLLAANVVAWGLHLCDVQSIDGCVDARRKAARHPGFVARRAVVESLEKRANRDEIDTLVALSSDPIASVQRKAIAALVSTTGRADLQTGGDWRKWFEAGGLKPSAAGDRERQATGAAASP